MIERMAAAWRNFCAMDHHKSRDYYWYISIEYDGSHKEGKPYDLNGPKYQASHNGYIAHQLSDPPERASLEEAYQDLAELLIEAFKGELEWAGRVLEGPEDWDETDRERAKYARTEFGRLIRDYYTSGGR